MSELLNRAKNNVVVLRQKREILFKAFDIYKTNVSVGIEKPTEEQWQKIVKWYTDCKDLLCVVASFKDRPNSVVSPPIFTVIPLIPPAIG